MKSPKETASAQPLSPGPPRLTSCLLKGALNLSWDLGVGWGGLAGAHCESKLPCEVPLTSLHWKGGRCPSLSLLWRQLWFFLFCFVFFVFLCCSFYWRHFPLMVKFKFEIWATSNVNIFQFWQLFRNVFKVNPDYLKTPLWCRHFTVCGTDRRLLTISLHCSLNQTQDDNRNWHFSLVCHIWASS